MRLFVAVEIDAGVVAAAMDCSRRLQRDLQDRVRARWVGAEQMHLTIRFIGQVEDERVAPLLDALRPPLPIAPFDVELGECGVFPPGGPPRAIWIGLAAGLPSLRMMHEECDRRLRPLGYEPEARAFKAHLTLARVKDMTRGAGPAIREAVHGAPPRPARCGVGAATVFQSHLSPRGSTYETLLRIDLIP
jgi:2'-5' RNA ligase